MAKAVKHVGSEQIVECKHMEEVNDLTKLRDTLLSLTIYNANKHVYILDSIERALEELIPEAVKCIRGIHLCCKL